MEARIFVSYRRDDVAGDAGRLTDHLQRRFGKRRIFLDIDSIDPGIDFIQALDASLQTTAAMLVVIGPRWTSLRDAAGTRRLAARDDFVVREVEAALRRGIPVVPVLMQGAVLPAAADLPASIAALATRQAAVIDHDEFRDDVERLCTRLAGMVDGGRSRWLRWWPAAALAVVLAAGAFTYRTLRVAEVDQPESTSSASPIASAAVMVEGVVGPRGASPSDAPRTIPVVGTPPPAAPEGRPAAPAAGTPTSRLEAANASRAAVSPVPAATLTPDDVRREVQKLQLETQAADRARQIDTLLAEASVQRGRGQFAGAMATLVRARELDPGSAAVRQAQEAQAIEWLRNVRFESAVVNRPSAERFQPTFAQPGYVEAVKGAVALVDDALTSATGPRRADLLAHSGWATYMLWTYGQASGVWGPAGTPRPDPRPRYREALAIEPENPFANAMLAHQAFRVERDLPGAQRLFGTALRTRREVGFVRQMQWLTFGTDGQQREDRELIRVADDMRRHGERVSRAQAMSLQVAYRSVASGPNERRRQQLLDVLSRDEHMATVRWVFDDLPADDESLRQTISFVAGLIE